MQKPMPSIFFKGMSLILRFRDILKPRSEVLKEVEINLGFKVLDFGCGPGSYIAQTSNRVGKEGKVFALDIHPLAIKKIKKMKIKMGLSNVEVICSDCQTGLPDNNIDVVFLYDIFHMLNDKAAVLSELNRVLKKNGVLSFSDHHMKEKNILIAMDKVGLFTLSKKNKKTYSFVKSK